MSDIQKICFEAVLKLSLMGVFFGNRRCQEYPSLLQEPERFRIRRFDPRSEERGERKEREGQRKDSRRRGEEKPQKERKDERRSDKKDGKREEKRRREASPEKARSTLKLCLRKHNRV